MLTDPYTDILYAVEDGVATVTINRPDRFNAFRGRTVDELVDAFQRVWGDPSIGSVILTGAGDKAFSAGGDTKQRAETGNYGPTEMGIFQIDNLHRIIRDVPKPVIAAVNGVAIGGGHVLHVLCDISIAAEHARFGQVGPRVGSFDAGFGTTYLARVIGEKRAREMWYFCRQYDAATALQWGLVNAVVPVERLMSEALDWARSLLSMSPRALEVLKRSFNTDTEHQAGVANLAASTLEMYVATPEAREGARAFAEKRAPQFRAATQDHSEP